MHKKVIALTAVALYAMLAFLASVVTDFHDRSFPQALGVESQLRIDFADSPLKGDAALTELERADRHYELGLYRQLPDLDATGAQVFVDLDQTGIETKSGWFGSYAPARIVGVERLETSSPTGIYLVTDNTRLGEAITELREHGVSVERADAAPLQSVKTLTQDSGFAAPAIAGCALVASMTVFWLAVRGRFRALRVLAGGAPWRIQLQDLGGFAFVLTASATGVVAAGSVLVGLLRGWVYVKSFVTTAAVFESATLAVSLFVAVGLSVAAWPGVDLIARRLPAVRSLRWAARILQAATLATLIAYTGPAWTAAQNAQHNATQLAAWNELSDQVQVAFTLKDDQLDAIAPRLENVVAEAEADSTVALSYTITEDSWDGDFGGYSAIALVNDQWIALMSQSVGTDALTSVPESAVRNMVARELGPSLETWSGQTATAAGILDTLSAYEPATDVDYPVAEGGSLGELMFTNDVLILEVPTIGTVFSGSNIASLTSTGNIIFTGATQTRARLDAAGLDGRGLHGLGIEGAVRVVYVAEQGILEAQFATYLAGLLAVSLIALALAFLVAAAVNAMIAGLLHAHRDFPIRLAGTRWEQVTRPRALREAALGTSIALVLVLVLCQPAATMGVTAAVATVGIAVLYASHSVVASVIFRRVTHREL